MEIVHKRVPTCLEPELSPALESQSTASSESAIVPVGESPAGGDAVDTAAFTERRGEPPVDYSENKMTGQDIPCSAAGLLQPAMDRAIENYLRARRRKIPEFVRSHFSFAGSLRINKKALGADLIKAPLNTVWIVPYSVTRMLSSAAAAIGFKKIAGVPGEFRGQYIEFLSLSLLGHSPCL